MQRVQAAGALGSHLPAGCCACCPTFNLRSMRRAFLGLIVFSTLLYGVKSCVISAIPSVGPLSGNQIVLGLHLSV